jgi:hypothetical protein
MELTSGLVGKAGMGPTAIPQGSAGAAPLGPCRRLGRPPPIAAVEAGWPRHRLRCVLQEATDPRVHRRGLRHAPQQHIQDLAVDPDAPP